jgi:hypothetical protein
MYRERECHVIVILLASYNRTFSIIHTNATDKYFITLCVLCRARLELSPKYFGCCILYGGKNSPNEYFNTSPFDW